MNSSRIKFQPTGLFGRIFISLALAIFLAAGLLMTAAGAYFIIFPHFWPEVQIQVTSSELLDEPANSNRNERFKVEVAYTYNYEGQSCDNKAVHTFDGYREAKAFVDRFSPGQTAAAHVNPLNPQTSTIQRVPLWMAVFLVIPLAFVGFASAGLYGVWFRGGMRGQGNHALTTTALSRNRPARTGGLFLVIFFSVFLLAGLGSFGVFFVRPVVKVIQAKNWTEVPCTIISSKVRTYHDSDGNTQHRADILYRYSFEGEAFQSSQDEFLSMSGNNRSRKLVAQYPAGSEARCYVNPTDPTEAVLQRNFTPAFLFGLLPLIFVGVGASGLIYQFRNRSQPHPERPGFLESKDAPPGWNLTGHRSAATITPSAPLRGGPIVLKPGAGPWAKFFGTLLAALFWNGIVSVFVYQVVEGWREGRGEWFLTLFIVPFVLIGLALIGGVFYFLLALANPRPSITVPSQIVPLGETIQIEWRLHGRVHSLHDLRLSFVGLEEARYRRGTSTCTDIETFAEFKLANLTNHFDMRSGTVRLTVPAGTMHSLDTGNNKIRWELRVQGAIRFWPDLDATFPITVSPMSISAIRMNS